jgi:hypothetical protein
LSGFSCWGGDAHGWGVGVVFALYAVGFGDKTGF